MKEPYCRIGSVKTNIGHLDTAAGVVSLIKASLSLHHKLMVPSLHFERPNPIIPFAGSPFEVNDTLGEELLKKHPGTFLRLDKAKRALAPANKADNRRKDKSA